MAEKEPEINISKGSLDGFHRHLKEAEVYLQQGLLDEARNIYAALHRKLTEKLEEESQTKTLRPSVHTKLQTAARSLENRLKEIDQRKAAFLESAGGPVKKVDANLTAEEMILRGILLRGLGFYDDAVDEFRRAASHRPDLVGDCYEHIGVALIGKGDVEHGISLLRQALDLEKAHPTRQVSLLEKIAETHEASGNKQQAVSTYRELIFLDENCGRALKKIEQLSIELKRSPLELAFVCRYPKRLLCAAIILALFFMAFIPSVKTVDNVDYFILEQHPDTLFYNKMKSVFGNDEFFIIAFESEALFSPNRLETIKKITNELEAVEEVEEVVSIGNVNDIAGGEDYFETRKFLEDIPEDPGALEALKKSAISNKLYVGNLISSNGRTAAIIIRPFDKPDDPEFRKRLVEKTEKILRPYEKEFKQFHLGGSTITNLRLSQYLKEDMAVFVPATYLFIMIAVWLFFRNVILTLLAIANISVCVGATFGLMGLTGVTENNITSIVIPLVMALALCDTVHIFSHLDINLLARFPDEKEALAHILNRVGLPCFLTTLTTAVGFFSLSVSEIQPIKEFAWIASAGMVFEFLFSFFFLPPLLLLFNPRRVYCSFQEGSGMAGLLKALFIKLVKYKRWIVAAGILIVVWAAGMTTQLRVETNLIEFFKEKSQVRAALTFIGQHLAGVETMDISFKAQVADAFKEPSNLFVIEKVQRFVDGLDSVDKTLSFVDFLKDMNQSFHGEDSAFYRIPDSMELVSQYLLLYDSEDTEDYINPDYNHARLAIRISSHSSAAHKELMQKMNVFLGTFDSQGIEIQLTGRAVNFVRIIDALVNSQIYSLGLATLVISVIMFIVFRSVSLAALSLIPNLFPIVLNFGIMGATGIALDTGTAIIAAVAIGIAVDDTIHFLSEYQRKRVQGLGLSEAVEQVIFQKGHAIIASSVILSIGFSVLLLSRFAPVTNFGLLCAIIMITALIGDMILLPAVMLLKKKKTA